jgi:hypothetical protein
LAADRKGIHCARNATADSGLSECCQLGHEDSGKSL